MDSVLHFLVAITFAVFSNAQCHGSMTTTNNEFKVKWIAVDGYAEFNISATTTNWVAVGFSLSANMVYYIYIYIYIICI